MPSFQQLVDTVGGLVEMGTQAIQGVARVGAVAAQAAPEVLERSSQLVGGVVRTANETAPVLEKVVQLKRLLLNIIAALSSAEMRAVLFQEVASI